MTHRFFVDEEIPDEPVLRGDRAHQIASVLRLRPGESITLVRDGTEAEVRLETVNEEEAHGRVIGRCRSETELRFGLTLAIPLLKGDHDEEVVEAVTQLGVKRIVPFVSARSVVRSQSGAKRERWRRIARESAETARRGRVPVIDEPRTWETLFDSLDPGALVAWEGEALVPLREALPRGDVSIVVGPEGGLGVDEIAFARERGARTVSLGPRNLRSETAAIAAVAQAVAALESLDRDKPSLL
jgi:16S rRNA (uracil1498-N3)-methyltransferase